MSVDNLDRLLPEEREEIRDLLEKYDTLINNRNYEASDKLRYLLYEWDFLIINNRSWHPFFESSEHRKERAFKRMRKYNISIYPWSLEDLKNG